MSGKVPLKNVDSLLKLYYRNIRPKITIHRFSIKIRNYHTLHHYEL